MEDWRKPSAVSQGRNGQSALGIASLAIAIVSILARFIMLLFMGISGISGLSAAGDKGSLMSYIVFFCFLVCIGLDFLSIGLGIGGIFQKINIRVCAFIGIALSTSAFVITVGSIVAIIKLYP